MTGTGRVWVGTILAAGLALLADSPRAQRLEPIMRPARETDIGLVCATDDDSWRQSRVRPHATVPVGGAVSFRQDPSILTPDYAGTVTLREFTVVGDVPSVRIKLDIENSEIVTFPRTETRQTGGYLVSIFSPSWPASTWAEVLHGNRWGWDLPRLWWGEFLADGVAPGMGRFISLRIAPTSLPVVQVERPTEDIQYSSSVVNIVLPGFAAGYIGDDHSFQFAQATTKFYQHFQDTYDSLAFVPQEIFLAPYNAFHRNVQNDVRGIGLSVFDNSLAYGSAARRLRSVELYLGASLATGSSSHEIAHQWGAYIDWSKLVGLPRAGHQPEFHDPLWAEGETLVGGVLHSSRRVRQSSQGWLIERTPAPPKFHPFTLYAMGLIPAAQVPEVTLFDEQSQFGASGVNTPEVGRQVTGATRTATIFNVIGMLGERSGPVLSAWHRGTIVVSAAPLSQREMDYWTFFVRRLDDPNRTGLVGYDGLGSFEAATSQRMDLRTDIRPLVGAAITPRSAVDAPDLGRREFRDVTLDASIPTRYRVGERARWSGVVNARDRSDFNQITLRLWKSGGTAADSIRASSNVSSTSSFLAETEFRAEHRGVYLMEVFLFWPDSGSQFSRVAISPVVIE